MSEVPTATSTASARTDVERWFLRRGVPQLIEGYSSEPRMDSRAAPLIVAWLAIGSFLFWATSPSWHPVLNALAAIANLSWVLAAFAGIRWLRGRPLRARGETFDPVDIALLGFLPTVATGIIAGSSFEFVLAGLNALLGIGVIYVIIGFGLLEIAAWGARRLANQVGEIIGLVGRTLPILLILVVFLLFAAELWEAARELRPIELAAVIGLLVVVACVLIVTNLRAELHRMEGATDEHDTIEQAASTPAAALAIGLIGPVPLAPALTWIQRVNLHALALISQLIQSVFVALVVMAFLVVFGLIALPVAVQESWMGAPASVLATFELLGETRRLSGELVTVAAVLAGIVGLYFTGLALTDGAYREQHFSRIVTEIREILAARRLYLAAAVEQAPAAPEPIGPAAHRRIGT